MNFYTKDFTMEKFLSYVTFGWFFPTTAHHEIFLMFLVRTKLVTIFFKVSSWLPWRNSKNASSELCEKGSSYICIYQVEFDL